MDGGRVPPGTFEVRRAALIINYTPRPQRKATQRQLELSRSVRNWKTSPISGSGSLMKTGCARSPLVVTGADSNIVSNVASELGNQMKRIP